MRMEYLKPHLSIPEQAELLIERGLEADASLLEKRLSDVGYYRFSAYLHPFRVRDCSGIIGNEFIPGTTLEKVWAHYLFDRRLRFLMLDAIERIEVALRSRIAHLHTEGQSPFAYAQPTYFPHWKGYINCLDRVHIQRDRLGNVKQCGVDFIDHFFNKYGDKHDYLPLWMAVGVMDFGMVVYFYTHSRKKMQNRISTQWGVDAKTLYTWLTSLRVLRNDCAHHARIWNKTFLSVPRMNNTPFLPWDYVYSEKAHKWVKPTGALTGAVSMMHTQSTIAPLIFICRHLLKHVAPSSRWHIRMQDFLHDSQRLGIPLHKMGLPENWECHPLWK